MTSGTPWSNIQEHRDRQDEIIADSTAMIEAAEAGARDLTVKELAAQMLEKADPEQRKVVGYMCWEVLVEQYVKYKQIDLTLKLDNLDLFEKRTD